jgi:hypothetical protein
VPAKSAASAATGRGLGQVPGFDVAIDISHATKDVAAFLVKYYTAKSAKDEDATMSYFAQQNFTYIDAVLGWSWYTWESLRKSLYQFMPNWPKGSGSYPTRILGDMNSALVFFTDTPGLFGSSEILTLGAINIRGGKIARQIDYWDARHFGVAAEAKLKVPANKYPTDFGVSDVGETAAPAMKRTVNALAKALKSGDGAAAAELFSPAALFEDETAHLRITGPRSIGSYLTAAASLLPYAGRGTGVRHVLGSAVGGGYEWTATDSPVPQGVTALELDRWGKISRLTAMWNGSLVDDTTLTSLARLAIER